jgi:hypothetical protein
MFQDLVFGKLQQGVQAAQYHHGQDDITVFAPDVDITKAVVGIRPDEGYDFIMYSVVHLCPVRFGCLAYFRYNMIKKIAKILEERVGFGRRGFGIGRGVPKAPFGTLGTLGLLNHFFRQIEDDLREHGDQDHHENHDDEKGQGGP